MTIMQTAPSSVEPADVVLDIEEIEVHEEEVGIFFMRERQDVTH